MEVRLHTHTPFSTDTPWYGLPANQQPTPEDWLRRWMAAGIDCLAITDHNGAGWVDEPKQAYGAMQLLGDLELRPRHGFRRIVQEMKHA